MRNPWRLILLLATLFFVPFPAQGAEPILIAIASDDVEATSLVSYSAGRSRYYLLFSGTDFVQTLDNPFLAEGPGVAQLLVEYLAQKGVGVIIAGGFDPLMIGTMDNKGIKYIIFSGIAQVAAERVIKLFPPQKK